METEIAVKWSPKCAVAGKLANSGTGAHISMFGGYQEREEYEDELYHEEEGSSNSEVDSELEFRLYSQLHYSLNHEEEQEHEPDQEQEQKGEQQQAQQDPIIISSGPEVITVSDSTDEDDGICTSKDQKIKLQDSAKSKHSSHMLSTQGQPQSRTAGHEFISLDSDSDSDGVENWMILGQKKLDVDCSIQLNLEGTADSSASEDTNHDDQNWSISEKDMQAQIGKRWSGVRHLSCRYYEKKNVTCRSCNKAGHLSKNCPTPKKLPACLLCGTQGHLQRSCPHQYCTNCTLPGHDFTDCPEPAYWKKHCHRCAMTGHFYDACPEIWRQYHLTTQGGPPLKPFTQDAPKSPAYCYNCSRKGHFGFECKDKRMFNGTYPTTPYISYYDTPRDIRQRNNRMTRKAQKLQKAGFLLHPEVGKASQGKVSEEGAPPTKKQKKNQGGFSKEGKQRTPTTNKKQEKKQLQLTVKPWPEKRKERRQLKKLRKQTATQQPGERKQDLLQMEEDFPRGPFKKVKGASTPNFKCKPNSSLFNSSMQTEKKGKKRQARTGNKQPGAVRMESLYDMDENLFVIKQRKKCKRRTLKNL
ncbi:zinc finger CCHC domain-containing protein 7 [Arapaima gigas]